jgi:hypothetical protein
MSNNPKLTINQQIFEAKIKVMEAYEEYVTALYFETMPEYDPQYSYSYAHSNFKIAGVHQSVVYWLRAVHQHMNLRGYGHGGEKSDAAIINVFNFTNQKTKDIWIAYETRKLNKMSKIVKKI